MSVYSGDFLGFRLGDIHSSDLNITRVSSGDRYSENLTPNFTDTTAQVPGGDGTYYWNTFYSQKPFTIDFAFDDLRDEDIRRLKQIFSFKGVKELVFDETAFKKYYVKCSQPPSLKYISFPFDEVKVYKGEGSVNLVAYYPYGISTQEMVYDNRKSQEISNIGDLDTPFKLYFTIGSQTQFKMVLKSNGVEINRLEVNNLSKLNTTDKYICFDMRTHLIEGLDTSLNKTGTLYNRFITKGDFFLFPVGRTVLSTNVNWYQLKLNWLYY